MLEPGIEIDEKNNNTIVYYKDHLGQINPLSSRIAPRKEAKRSVKELKSPQVIFLLGLGNFYLGLEIIRSFPQIPLFIIEPIRAIKEGFTGWLEKYYPNLAQAKNFFYLDSDRWYEQIEDSINGLPGQKLHFIKNQKQSFIFSELYERIEKRIFSLEQKKKVNRSTIAKFDKIWLRNLVKNTQFIFKSFPLKEIGNWGTDKPIAIIGAGPSLAFELEELRKNQDKLFIFACDTSVSCLLKHGITPDFIASLDPQNINAKYLENLPQLVYDNSILFHEPSIPNSALRYFKKRVIFDAIFPYFKLIKRFTGSFGQLQVGGSVITLMLEIVKKLNFKNNIFLGLDLCYKKSHYHIPATYYEETWFSTLDRFRSHQMLVGKIINSKDETETINLQKEKVFTDTKFKLFKKWIEEKIPHNNNNFYNGSTTGVAVKNLTFLNFSDFIKKYKFFDKENCLKKLHYSINNFFIKEESKSLIAKKKFYQEIFFIKKKLAEEEKIFSKLLEKADFSKKKNLKEIFDFQFSNLTKPFIEIVLQKSLHDLEDSENLAQEQIIRFYQSIKKSIAINLKYFSKINL